LPDKAEPQAMMSDKKYIAMRVQQGVSESQLKAALAVEKIAENASKAEVLVLDSLLDVRKNWNFKEDPTGAATFGDLREFNPLFHAIM
jgi:hypothetical protein